MQAVRQHNSRLLRACSLNTGKSGTLAAQVSSSRLRYAPYPPQYEPSAAGQQKQNARFDIVTENRHKEAKYLGHTHVYVLTGVYLAALATSNEM